MNLIHRENVKSSLWRWNFSLMYKHRVYNTCVSVGCQVRFCGSVMDFSKVINNINGVHDIPRVRRCKNLHLRTHLYEKNWNTFVTFNLYGRKRVLIYSAAIRICWKIPRKYPSKTTPMAINIHAQVYISHNNGCDSCMVVLVRLLCPDEWRDHNFD